MLFFVLLTVLIWGLWGFLGKLATRYNSPVMITAISSLVSPIFAVVLFSYIKMKSVSFNSSPLAVFLIVLTFLAGVSGSLAYYYALTKGNASVVVSLTSLYPAVTILLSVLILREKINIIQAFGFSLVLLGAFLINKD